MALFVLAVAAACGGNTQPPQATAPTITATAAAPATPSATAQPTQSATATPIVTSPPLLPSQSPSGVPLLKDGPLTPGTYMFVLRNSCDDPPRNCPAQASPPPALGIELTVPSGWAGSNEFLSISPAEGRETGAPNNSALVMGWTSFWVGLNSEPCAQTDHQPTDIEVGPSVDDFVEAVVAHPKLDPTKPTDVTLGGYSGRFFSLAGPADLDGCVEWRPWDPGFFMQGPNNIWDVWVMDVNGFRVVIVADYFPQTPAGVKAELRQIAESIRFVPIGD